MNSNHEMKIDQVLNCQINKWYPLFRKVTFKTKLHKLSQEFVDYLREDGIVIHEDYTRARNFLTKIE